MGKGGLLMPSKINFPYPECTQKDIHPDFCSEKQCRYLVSFDNWQTCKCELFEMQLEQDYKLIPILEDEPEKTDFCYYCNNTENFTRKNGKTKCALCNRFSSKTDIAEVEGLRAGIKAGIFKSTYPYY